MLNDNEAKKKKMAMSEVLLSLGALSAKGMDKVCEAISVEAHCKASL